MIALAERMRRTVIAGRSKHRPRLAVVEGVTEGGRCEAVAGGRHVSVEIECGGDPAVIETA